VHDLQRFTIAQNAPSAGIDAALAELRSGRKTGHWIWYVFPQIAGLGRSEMSRRYAIADADEAAAYLRDDTLRGRLLDAMEAVLDAHNRGVPLAQLIGSTLDAAKLISSMTLFHDVALGSGATGSEDEFRDIADLAGRVLRAGGTEGVPACEFTRRMIRT